MLKFIAKPGINFPDERDTTPIIKKHIIVESNWECEKCLLGNLVENF
jgi:hypothetical protein